MDEDGEKRVHANQSGEIDRISNLPDSLIFDILLNIPTKDVVKTSVLSSRWRNLWRDVPGLDLNVRDDFPNYNTFMSFVDLFLGLNSECRLQNFKLKYAERRHHKHDINHVIKQWINTVVKRKVQHLHILDSWYLEMPPTLYTCESLVSLKLSDGSTEDIPKFFSLPSLKVMVLTNFCFYNDLRTLEMLISGCPMLERLYIEINEGERKGVLRVCSQSLLSFTYIVDDDYYLIYGEELVVEIDAPKLEYLKLYDDLVSNFVLTNTVSLVKAVIETGFKFTPGMMFDPIYLPKLNMIRSLLVGISTVKDMVINSDTLKMFNDFSKFEQLPMLRNLYSLRVVKGHYTWQMLPTFLESCPNLKSLVVYSQGYTYKDLEEDETIHGPRCLLASLESVEIESPFKGEATEMKLVSYLLENSSILKKLTLSLDYSIKKEESAFFKEVITIPRLSSSCQLVIL